VNPHTQEARIKVRDGAVLWRELDGETVLLALESSMYLTLNETGTVLWPLMVEGTTSSEMVERLVAGFDVDPRRAAADATAFVDACRAQSLLEA